MQSTNLYLIRHGQSLGSVEPIVAGMKGDAGLTPFGVQQAQRLHDRLATSGELQVEVFLASSLPRALQTARIIAPALGLAPTLDDDLHELRPTPSGDGLPREEYVRRFGWVSFEDDATRPVGPGGESWASFAARISHALSRITREHEGKSIVAVCHGGVINAAFMHFFAMPLDRVPAAGFHTHNTSITHWAHDTSDERPRWRLVRYNDDAHLSGLGEAPAAPLPAEPR